MTQPKPPHNWRHLTLEKSLLMDKLDTECTEAWQTAPETTITIINEYPFAEYIHPADEDLPFITCITKEPDVVEEA